ncbi:hypothetical protein Tco_0073037 [Tanacetum coccineum]
MNEKGVDSSKSEVSKEESKEQVQMESKEEESTRKRKLGTRKKMKSRKRRYIQNTSEDDSDKENDELRLHLTIASDEEKETDQAEHFEEINQNVVIRSNGQKRYFSTLIKVLSIFDREDLNTVYQLVMDRFQDEIPEGFNRVLWEDLMLHGSSGVHTLVTEKGLVIHMLVEKKYPLRKEVLMQMLKLKLESKEDKLTIPSKRLTSKGTSKSDNGWYLPKNTKPTSYGLLLRNDASVAGEDKEAAKE